jgi:hypothetical protein
MKLARALLAILILISIISKVSIAAYQKDMDVLTTINEVEHQDQKFAIQEKAKATRDSIILDYALGIFTLAFFASFLFDKKTVFANTAEENKINRTLC